MPAPGPYLPVWLTYAIVSPISAADFIAMSFDYSSVFLAIVVATGMILLLEIAGAVAGASKPAGQRPWLVELAHWAFPVALVVLLVRCFVVEPFRIPSASMMPGLVEGDFILVSKFSYGLRLPVTHKKILSIGEPKRGDVVVFRLPSDPSVDFIKRLVGLPGDHILVRHDRVFINGVLAPLEPHGTYAGNSGFEGSRLAIERFGGQQHVIMFADAASATDFEGTVPDGHYFFMGDNRDDSEDSRFGVVGFVPEQNLVGHAVGIFMNWHRGRLDLKRVGKKIL